MPVIREPYFGSSWEMAACNARLLIMHEFPVAQYGVCSASSHHVYILAHQHYVLHNLLFCIITCMSITLHELTSHLHTFWAAHKQMLRRRRDCQCCIFYSCTLGLPVWHVSYHVTYRRRNSFIIYVPLTLKVLNFWKCTSSCSLKPLWSGMGEVGPARTSPTLHPHPLPLCINCCD